MADQDLEQKVKGLIAAGASDDDIAFFIKEYPKQTRTTLDEAKDFLSEGAKTVGRTALGVGEMLLNFGRPINPVAMAEIGRGLVDAISDPKKTLQAIKEDQFGGEDLSTGGKWGRRMANLGMAVAPFTKGAFAGKVGRAAQAVGELAPITTAEMRVAPMAAKAVTAEQAAADLARVGGVPKTGARPFTQTTAMRVPEGPIVGSTTTPAPARTVPPTGGSAPSPREGHFKLPKVAQPEEALKAAERNGVLNAKGTMPVPITDEVYKAGTERRLAAGSSPTGVERRGAITPSLNTTAAQTASTRGSATMTPADMRAMYGSRRAADRMGVSQDELLDMAPGPSRTPKIVEEAAEDAAYRNRIADEGPYLYSGIDPRAIFNAAKKYPKLFGAAGGAAIGANVDENDPLGGALLGGVGGVLAGQIAKGAIGQPGLKGKIGGALGSANDLRVESMLSGSAIPKNIAAAVGNTLTAQAENLGAPAKLANSPVKELLRLPTNTKVLKDAFKNPTMTTATNSSAKVKGPIGRTIGAIDETFVQAMKRAGLTDNEIERLALTADNDMFSQIGQTTLGRFMFPFQRTPANMMVEGIGEGNALIRGVDTRAGRLPKDLPHVNPSMRRALTGGAAAGGVVAGDAVASSDNKKRNATLLGIMLAALGPRAAIGTMGAAAGGAGRLGIGSISPIQEYAFEPKNWHGMPPAFFRFIENLEGKQ